MNTRPFRPHRRNGTKLLSRGNTITASRSIKSTSRAEVRRQTKILKESISTAPILHLEQIEADTNLRQRALAEAQQGRYENAIRLFSRLIDRNPDSAIDYNNRGLVYFRHACYNAAIADYNKAIALNPRLDSVYNNRANFYACCGDLHAAIHDYERAIDLNPGNVRAWINQGITFRDLNMYEEAIETLETALSFGQLEGHIYAELGRTRHLQGDWNFAIADYQHAIFYLPSFTHCNNTPSMRLRLQVEVWLDDLNPLVL